MGRSTHVYAYANVALLMYCVRMLLVSIVHSGSSWQQCLGKHTKGVAAFRVLGSICIFEYLCKRGKWVLPAALLMMPLSRSAMCVWAEQSRAALRQPVIDGVLGNWSHSHGWETPHSAESSTFPSFTLYLPHLSLFLNCILYSNCLFQLSLLCAVLCPPPSYIWRSFIQLMSWFHGCPSYLWFLLPPLFKTGFITNQTAFTSLQPWPVPRLSQKTLLPSPFSLPFWRQRALHCRQGSVHCSSPYVYGTPFWWCLLAARTYQPQHTYQFSCPTRTVQRTPEGKRQVSLFVKV